ncbi:MAG: alpha/beta fold hydrolase [Propionibacteriaceae bacterium]
MAAEFTATNIGTFGGRAVGWSRRAGRSPAVLLLGGCGVGSWVWPALIALLGDRAVIMMDRPGMAGTPWPGRLPTLAEEISTLAELLDHLRTSAAGGAGSDGGSGVEAGAGDAAGVVVVGHSMAGPHAEALARSRPELVAGLVLADGSTEPEPKIPDPATERRWLTAARVARQAMRLRPVQPLGPLVDRVLSANQSHRMTLFDDVSPAARTAYRDPDTVAMVVAEQAAYDRQLTDLDRLRATHDLPEIPVRVVTAAGDGGESWVRAQDALTRRLHGEQIVLPDSRHLIMLDRPDALAAAIAAVGPS